MEKELVRHDVASYLIVTNGKLFVTSLDYGYKTSDNFNDSKKFDTTKLASIEKAEKAVEELGESWKILEVTETFIKTRITKGFEFELEVTK